MRAYILPSGCAAIDDVRRGGAACTRSASRSGARPRARGVVQSARSGDRHRHVLRPDDDARHDSAVGRRGRSHRGGRGRHPFQPRRSRRGRLLPDASRRSAVRGSRESLGFPLDGSLAEQMVAVRRRPAADSDGLSFEEAACLPCAGVTAWNALMVAGRPRAGRRHRAGAGHGRRLDVRAAVCDDGRGARDRDVVERREARTRQAPGRIRRRELHAHARLAQGSLEAYRWTRRRLRRRSGRRRHAGAVVRLDRGGRQGRAHRRDDRPERRHQPVRLDVEGRRACTASGSAPSTCSSG